MTDIPLYFDFISPYAYFAHLQVPRIEAEAGVRVVYRPVLFAALLDHHGQLGPAEIPAKREATFRDISRYAARHDVALTGPAAHPFNPMTALRVALPEVAGDRQRDVIDRLFRQGWGHGLDLGDPAAIAATLTEAGMPGADWVARTREPAVKAALRVNTEAAVARGVFGVPTFEIGDELVWGNDQVSTVLEILAGDDPLPRDAFERLLAIPSAASRPRAKRS